MRKQIAGLMESYDRHKQTLDLILHNQKKMVKAMQHHQVRKLYLNKLFIYVYLDSDYIV